KNQITFSLVAASVPCERTLRDQLQFLKKKIYAREKIFFILLRAACAGIDACLRTRTRILRTSVLAPLQLCVSSAIGLVLTGMALSPGVAAANIGFWTRDGPDWLVS